MSEKFIRSLIDVEVKYGFLYIPASGIKMMPSKNSNITVTIDGKTRRLNYNADHKRITGLTTWFKLNKIKKHDNIIFIKKILGHYALLQEKTATSSKMKNTEELLTISGLSSQAKGDVVENRIKDLVLLHGQGLLNAYTPVIDTDGIDMIVVRNGMFQSIFLQIKSRYRLQQKSLILTIGENTFKPNKNYYVVGAYFNPEKMDVGEHLILVPSKEITNKAISVKLAHNKNAYRIVASLDPKSNNKWSKHIIRKEELSEKLIEAFESMQETHA